MKSAAGLVALSLAALALGGCSLGKSEKSLPPPPPTDTTSDVGGLGTAITLRGSEPGAEVEVTVTRVLDPVAGSPADQTLHPGDRFVGVELRLRNIGRGLYSESPLSDSKLLLADGSQADGVNLLGGPCGGRFPLHVSLRPGDRASGCLPFELARGRRPDRFQFALDSGYATEVGTWNLR